MVIGLSGRRGSGKNTVADFIAAHFDKVEQLSFAGKLKHSAARIFVPEITEEDAVRWADGFKNHGSVTMKHWSEDGAQLVGAIDVTGREFLQRYGTEAHRDIFSDDFWVDALLPSLVVSPYAEYAHGSIKVITDVRFINEAKRIRQLNGKIIEVVRPDVDTGDKHASEEPLPTELVDFYVNNTSSFEKLEELTVATVERILS